MVRGPSTFLTRHSGGPFEKKKKCTHDVDDVERDERALGAGEGSAHLAGLEDSRDNRKLEKNINWIGFGTCGS
jgi:hypothetical protein